jgi:hypothetical protein
MRRHRAATAAAAALLLVVGLAGGLAWNVRAARVEDGAAIAERVYDRLAFTEYRVDETRLDEAAELQRAAALGADTPELRLSRAILAAGDGDAAEAAAQLQPLLDENPADARAWYILAWAQRRAGQAAAMTETIARAEASASLVRPEDWFFRGLALHWEQPAAAVAAYQRANQLRAEGNRFYPQAILHLARARNQRLYNERTLDGFAEARDSLRLLINHGYYGAYPYYLLSIAYRLAGEIYSGSEGVRGDTADAHFAQALHWARAGQEVDPTNDAPVAAEAMCLESLGRYAEAIDARTRAVALAETDADRWEACHYRWRLYFWTEQHDGALDDLAACAAFASGAGEVAPSPLELAYRYYYPALVHAARGEPAVGARLLDELITADGPPGADRLLWGVAGFYQLGEAARAEELLALAATDEVDLAAGLEPPFTAAWRALLLAALRGDVDLAEPEAFASEVTQPWRLAGEAYYHLGIQQIASGNDEVGRALLGRALRTFDGEQRYSYHARVLLGW